VRVSGTWGAPEKKGVLKKKLKKGGQSYKGNTNTAPKRNRGPQRPKKKKRLSEPTVKTPDTTGGGKAGRSGGPTG